MEYGIEKVWLVAAGDPVIAGTGIRVESVRSLFAAEGSIDVAAGEYSLTRDQVEDALRWCFLPKKAREMIPHRVEQSSVDAVGPPPPDWFTDGSQPPGK